VLATAKSVAPGTSRIAQALLPAAPARHVLGVQAVLARGRLPVARYRTMAAATAAMSSCVAGIGAAGD
jgi:hypothetical protein